MLERSRSNATAAQKGIKYKQQALSINFIYYKVKQCNGNCCLSLCLETFSESNLNKTRYKTLLKTLGEDQYGLDQNLLKIAWK